MRKSALLLLGSLVCAGAQTPVVSAPSDNKSAGESAVPWTATFTSDAGFNYSYPSDWEKMDTKPVIPAARLRAEDSASSDVEKQAAGCTQAGLLLRHGVPRSAIVVVILPYSCVNGSLKQSDLSGVAMGIASALQKQYTVSDPLYTAYRLGKVEFWAERAQGSPKEHPEISMTLETTCGMLRSSLVCWMGFLRDEEALRVFEGGTTSVDGSAGLPLVPADAFKPSKKK